jgi:hypothetical protein
MARLYRKTVRDAIISVLADPATGFNTRLNASAVEYGITSFAIDWSGAAGNFALSYIDPANIEICELLNFPAACLYTDEAADTGLPRGITFSGQVIACLEFYQRLRKGIESFDTESLTDAIEDATMSALNDPVVAWPISQVHFGDLRAAEQRAARAPDTARRWLWPEAQNQNSFRGEGTMRTYEFTGDRLELSDEDVHYLVAGQAFPLTEIVVVTETKEEVKEDGTV